MEVGEVDPRIFEYVTEAQLEQLRQFKFSLLDTPEEAIKALIEANHDPELIKKYLDSLLTSKSDVDFVAGPATVIDDYHGIEDFSNNVR